MHTNIKKDNGKIVRVATDTHAKLLELSKRMGLTLDEVIQTLIIKAKF